VSSSSTSTGRSRPTRGPPPLLPVVGVQVTCSGSLAHHPSGVGHGLALPPATRAVSVVGPTQLVGLVAGVSELLVVHTEAGSFTAVSVCCAAERTAAGTTGWACSACFSCSAAAVTASMRGGELGARSGPRRGHQILNSRDDLRSRRPPPDELQDRGADGAALRRDVGAGGPRCEAGRGGDTPRRRRRGRRRGAGCSGAQEHRRQEECSSSAGRGRGSDHAARRGPLPDTDVIRSG
jgi:hypothetical protein